VAPWRADFQSIGVTKMANQTAFDFTDIQGIVRFGHGRLKAACMLLLQVKDPAAARRWLRATAFTSGATVNPPPDAALQIAFTAPGLARIGVSEDVLRQFSEEFLAGMYEPSRARHLGDTDVNDPHNWGWGGNADSLPDAILMLYALPGGLEILHQQLETTLFKDAFSEHEHLSTNHVVTTEPFGFADGISQPKIDWLREQTADLHRRETYSNLLSLGEVVLGYPNEYGEYTARPLLVPDKDARAAVLPQAEDEPQLKDLGRNGTYLVLRQLEQDAAGFWKFIDAQADHDPLKREALAEAMVGRKRDGTPLIPVTQQALEGIESDDREKNNFAFDDDPRGIACPIASHIRRSNPRTGDFPPGVSGFISRMIRILGFDSASRELDLVASTRFHRILRRGRLYGDAITPEAALLEDKSARGRGLHFICLAANIRRQFEFVQSAWSAHGKFAGLQDEEDPLMGNRKPLFGGTRADQFSQPQESGIRKCTVGIPQFVTVRGGAYFFLPGISALRYLAAEPQTPGPAASPASAAKH
jgi:deferrochelatase/peroxidase EfeB